MYEILRSLGEGARALDLGCYEGSFSAESCPGAQVIRLDRASHPAAAGFVQADAARLPFRSGSFDAVIANHCLEHMDDVDRVIREIGRVTRRGGSLYISVPDGSSWTDRIYRWMFHGGEHVNQFTSADDLARRITTGAGFGLVAIRVLHSSLWFLNRARFGTRPPRRLLLFGNGNTGVIAWLSYGMRWMDRVFGTRLSVYGWALYFGHVTTEVDTATWSNVCVGCGTAQSAAALESNSRVRGTVFRFYICPACGVWNLFTADPIWAAGPAALRRER